MKKLFFLLSSMNVGGVEKAFLGLLSTIPRDKYEVHLGLLRPQGGFMEYIPEDVTVHHVDCYEKYWRIINDPPLQTIKQFIKGGKIINGILHLLLYLHFKLTGSQMLLYKYLMWKEPELAGVYDIAVAYAGPSQAIDYYVCKKVQAKEKYGWIHFDVSRFGIDRGLTRKLYREYKKVMIVSETAKSKFDEIFPEFKNKTEVRYNVVDKTSIEKMAADGLSFSNDEFVGKKILTVGRLSKEKGQNLAIDAMKMLVDCGYDVRWYFVGDGNIRVQLEQQAKSLGIEKNIVFLGLQKNPYPYMRDCDVYVQPSQHEGFCITLAEAKIFNKPIVATDFTGAREQLENYAAGSQIVGHDAAEIANAIKRLL